MGPCAHCTNSDTLQASWSRASGAQPPARWLDRVLGPRGLMRLLPGLFLTAIVLIAAKGQMTRRVPVSLHGDGTSWIVRATLDGRTKAQFLLDTGASYCVITPALARELLLEPTGSFATLATANGPVRAPIVIVRSLDLGGGVYAHDVEAIVHDAAPQLDGLLGLNFLNRYRYAVDPERRLLELEWYPPLERIDPVGL